MKYIFFIDFLSLIQKKIVILPFNSSIFFTTYGNEKNTKNYCFIDGLFSYGSGC